MTSRAGGLNSLLSSVFNSSKRERYESYDDKSSNRWKTKKYDRSGNSGSFSHNSNKERIRSSGLTNSVENTKRNDLYLPGKKVHQSRYADRYSHDSDENDESEASRKDVDRAALYNDLLSGVDDENPHRAGTSQVDTSQDMNEEEEEENDEAEVEEDDEEEDEEEDNEEGEENDSEGDISGGRDLQQERGLLKRAKEKRSESTPRSSLSTLSMATNIETTNDSPRFQSPSHESSLTLTGAITYPEGCLFPQTEIDFRLEQLKFELATQKSSKDSFPTSTLRTEGFMSLPAICLNLKKFRSNFLAYTLLVKARNLELTTKRMQLWKTYDAYSKENRRRGQFMKEQLEFLHNADDETKKELDSIDIKMKTSELTPEFPVLEAPATLGRRGRRHGDLVTTEAEFQEILRTLKNEDNEDPLIKAKQVSAEIPDLILDPLEREAFKFMNSNNLVQDKSTWELRLKTDFATNFTENEHELYCDAFCRAPKRFGEISRIMGGLRSLHECVLHYYITKKNVNYKFMVSQYKKKTSKRNARRKKKAREGQIDGPLEITETVLQNGITDPAKPMDEDPMMNSKRSLDTDHSDASTGEPSPKRGCFYEADHETKATKPIAQTTNGETNISSRKEASQALVENHSLTAMELGVLAENGTTNTFYPEEELRSETQLEKLTSNGAALKASEDLLVHASKAVPSEGTPTEAEPIRAPERDIATPRLENIEGDFGEKKKQISSYWSITDVNTFPEYLEQFGSRWTLIADKLATKSATMVRNYYQRNAERFSWATVVAEADQKLAQESSSQESPSLVESTIVVKPQKFVDVEAEDPKTQVLQPVRQSAPTSPKKAKNHLVAATPFGPHQIDEAGALSSKAVPLSREVATQARDESHKPSILSLLNAEQKSDNTKIAPPPRSNDLAALLNASSSPVMSPKADNPEACAKANSISSLLG